jgi:methionyl-tRNA formyltransferase
LARKTSAASAIYHNAHLEPPAERRGHWHRLSVYADRVRASDDINGEEMRAFLASGDLDLLVLGQSGIIRPPILALPRIGTLNAHPGRLPGFRGVDVIRWTLLARQPPAVSLHFADKGVDTGDIIEVARFRFAPGCDQRGRGACDGRDSEPAHCCREPRRRGRSLAAASAAP